MIMLHRMTQKKINPGCLREQTNDNTSRQAEKPCPCGTRVAPAAPMCYQQHGQAPSAHGKCSQLPGAAPVPAAGPAADAKCKQDQAGPAAAHRGGSLRTNPI